VSNDDQDEELDIFRYTFFPKSEEEPKTQDTAKTKIRSNCRLPKIVINKKNFVFKEAIEQIQRDNKKRNYMKRKQIHRIRSSRVLSEEARGHNSKFDNM